MFILLCPSTPPPLHLLIFSRPCPEKAALLIVTFSCPARRGAPTIGAAFSVQGEEGQ